MGEEESNVPERNGCDRAAITGCLGEHTAINSGLRLVGGWLNAFGCGFPKLEQAGSHCDKGKAKQSENGEVLRIESSGCYLLGCCSFLGHTIFSWLNMCRLRAVHRRHITHGT